MEALIRIYSGEFEENLESWLARVVPPEGFPESVRGVFFRISDDGPDSTVGIEITGCSDYQVHGGDWSNQECWAPEERTIEVPRDVTEGLRVPVLKRLAAILARVLRMNSRPVRTLKTLEGMSIGVDSKDLEPLWASSIRVPRQMDDLPTEEQVLQLMWMIHEVFLHLRRRPEDAEQVRAMGNLFHNLPLEIHGWGYWSVEETRKYLRLFRQKYPDSPDWASGFDRIFPATGA